MRLGSRGAADSRRYSIGIVYSDLSGFLPLHFDAISEYHGCSKASNRWPSSVSITTMPDSLHTPISAYRKKKSASLNPAGCVFSKGDFEREVSAEGPLMTDFIRAVRTPKQETHSPRKSGALRRRLSMKARRPHLRLSTMFHAVFHGKVFHSLDVTALCHVG